MPVEASGTQPKYALIAEDLRRRCRALTPGSRLPPEGRLAAEFEVSRMTVRQALEQLAEDELVERIGGRGTFVRRPTLAKGQVLTSFTEDMRARGMRPTSTVIGLGCDVAAPHVARSLMVADDDAVLTIERLRFADDEPVCLETAHLLAGLEPLLTAEDVEGSLYAALRRLGVTVTTGTRRVRATSLAPREAMLLGLPDGSPALEVTLVVRDQRHRPVEHARSLYRPDRYEIVAEITSQPEPLLRHS